MQRSRPRSKSCTAIQVTSREFDIPFWTKDSAAVGLDEAMFMFGACASFAAYLAQKHRQAE